MKLALIESPYLLFAEFSSLKGGFTSILSAKINTMWRSNSEGKKKKKKKKGSKWEMSSCVFCNYYQCVLFAFSRMVLLYRHLILPPFTGA